MLRVGLAAAMAIIGYNAISRSLATVTARGDIGSAHRLAPGNGWITARLAMSLSGPDATERDRKRADALAREALRRDATAVAAVAALGINAEVRGEKAAARRLFTYARTLSRRDLTTQLWAIEDAVRAGDIAGALRHYDVALRASPESSDLLFPVLTAASADPVIRPALIRMLAGEPIWGEAFISHVARKGEDPRATAVLLVGLRRAGVAVPDAARAAVVNALVTAGYADLAWSLYASDRPGADRRRSRDPRFIAGVETPSQLDWMPTNGSGISTSILRGEQGGIFEFFAPASVGGPLLQQSQMLPPGDYRLVGHSDGIDQPQGERPYWLLTCHDGREFGRLEMPNSVRSNGHFAGRLVVPPGCGIQMLALIARPSSAASGLSGRIDYVQLEPAR